MLSTQTNIALQLVATLTGDEFDAFTREFEKMRKKAAKKRPGFTTPKNKKPVLIMPEPEALANFLLLRHRAKHSSANNLHNSLDVAEEPIIVPPHPRGYYKHI